MMERKPRFGINPPSRDIKFKFDKESTKDFGGMVIDRKVTVDATSKPSRRPKERPVSSGVHKRAAAKAAAEAKLANLPKPGSSRRIGNKELAMEQGKGGRGADRYTKYRANSKKSTKKRPPFIIDTFKG